MVEGLNKVQDYYDSFSENYEKERYQGYHLLIDELEMACLKGFIENKVVLEAGCGTGLILQRIAKIASEAYGVDLSEKMLKRAKDKGLNVIQGSITELPFEDNYFDVVCSFKVLSHVEDVKKAISEMSRVLKPGGVLVLEFYNTKSLRYIIKQVKSPTKTSDKYTDKEVYTRYDNIEMVINYLSPELKLEKMQGIRIFTPCAYVYQLPVISNIYKFLERTFRDSFLSGFGGFLVVTVRKQDG